jgi:peptide deformylase
MSPRIVLDINKYPNVILHTKSQVFLKEEVVDLKENAVNYKPFADMMLDTMYTNEGIGLAGPQVGWGKRVVVVDTNYKEGNEAPIILLNPELHDLKGEQLVQEGCLSFPLIQLAVKRYQEGVLRGKDFNWEDKEFYVQGLECAVWQHEIDHLDGLLFIDKVSKPRRNMALKKYRKVVKLLDNG